MELKKELNLLDVFCIASGAMFSSGLFILPGMAFAQAGPAVVVSYLLAGLLALTGMLSQAELVSAMPKAGGTYFYVMRSLGPAVGTVNGLITWFSLALKSALALVGMAAFAKVIVSVTDFQVQLIAVAFCILFVIVNFFGTKGASWIQTFLVIGLLVILLYYVVRGLPMVHVPKFHEFTIKGAGAIFSTAGFVFISYGGLLKVASIAEEVKDPGRTVPLGMILSLLVASLFYFFVIFVTVGVLEPAQLAQSLTPISDGAEAFMGQSGMIILSVAAILAFVSTANAGIMAASRYPLALGRDNLVPKILGRVNKRFGTPYIALVVTGLFMVGVLFLELSLLVKVASAVLILSFMFSSISIIILREGKLTNYQPQFRAPLYPVVQIIGILGCGFLLYGLGWKILLASLGLIVGGLLFYLFYGRIKEKREYALLHLIERITADELTDHQLENELMEIIRERDDIVKDRFDREIEEAYILDIDGTIEYTAFFKQVSEHMSKHLKMEPAAIYDLLMEREKDSSTVISPFLAIPHIIVEGEKKFDVLIARSKEGITFSESVQKVHAVFVLMGSKDERNFHLRALAAIAQVVDDSQFEKRWMKAKTTETLRDIVLLGERVRPKK